MLKSGYVRDGKNQILRRVTSGFANGDIVSQNCDDPGLLFRR